MNTKTPNDPCTATRRRTVATRIAEVLPHGKLPRGVLLQLFCGNVEGMLSTSAAGHLIRTASDMFGFFCDVEFLKMSSFVTLDHIPYPSVENSSTPGYYW